MRTLELASKANWSWRQVRVPPSPSSATSPTFADSDPPSSTGPWRPCSQIPSMIHEELRAAGWIPNFRLGRNEEHVKWVGESEWIYRCEFELHKFPAKDESADLVFEGLDTFATVFLNGKKILEASNMFVSHRASTRSCLLHGANTLYIVFDSAFRRGRELEERALGRGRHWPCWNGDPSRLFVRKGGFGWGWDWGPTVMTAGPFRPVRLEIYRSRISDFWPRTFVSETLEPSLSLSWQVSDAVEGLVVVARLVSSGGASIRKSSLDAASAGPGHVWKFDQDEVELWWTAGLGAQPLYTVQVDLVDTQTGSVLDTVSRRVGFRRLRLLRQPLDDPSEPGRTFLFELNNVPIFIGGSNWIPIDPIVTNAKEDRYRRWLQMARDGNQNMVRVWGGGLYEEEVFYNTCDELGLLVWQDLMFACGAYPAHLADFRDAVEEEVTQAIKRLRSHACLALVAANNEDYQIAEAEGLEYDPQDKDGEWLDTTFPARELYERMFPRLVAQHSDIFYWPGSPWGGTSTRDQTEGDVHVWDVWHGAQEPYQEYYRLGGRFVSEFGMEGAPDIRTIEYLLDGNASERYPQSRTLAAHNKATGHERRIACYLTENLRIGTSMEDYVYGTQFVQAEALTSALSGWRRKFTGGAGGATCAGALVWQLNDVWPATSWAIVDYFLRPKPAYFTMKRALAPIALGARRYTVQHFPDRFSAVNHVDKTYVDIWATNGHLDARRVILEVQAFELRSGERVHKDQRKVDLEANCSAELTELEVPAGRSPHDVIIVTARLLDAECGNVLARVSSYPEPFQIRTKHVSECRCGASILRAQRARFASQADRPVKGLVLHLNTDAALSDNFLDLVPGDEQVVQVRGLEKRTRVEWRYLGDEHSL